ncbi:40S ribosomal protein S6 [Sciurus carolinensis]|uniref:Small ribosomal subunit protein eS6 n=1 Tax=Sciurus carolinensis TaxID=30640 RepID=A0AA41NA99_SCICA|nr:40S ribosomal protein S6 [Sciurus carolinensis]
MKLTISFPGTGCQKLIEVDNEHKLCTFSEKCMATEVAADALGDEWKGYVVRINGGNDKQGFPMKQGVLTYDRVHLLLKKGEKDIPGLMDTTVPHRLGPKRARRTCKLFNLSKEDDVCQYVVRKPLNQEGKKHRTKAPKIEHLVTPHILQYKCRLIALKKQCTKKNKEEAAEYATLLAKRMKEAKEKRQEQIAKRCRLSSLRASSSKSESSQKEEFLRITNKQDLAFKTKQKNYTQRVWWHRRQEDGGTALLAQKDLQKQGKAKPVRGICVIWDRIIQN